MLGNVSGFPSRLYHRLVKRQNFNKTVTHAVFYSVSLTNKSINENTVDVILPVPQTTNYQTVLSLPKPAPLTQIRSEKKFDNKYVYWNKTLEPKAWMQFSVQCEVKVFPRNEVPQQAFSINDYQSTIALEHNTYINGQNKEILSLAKKLSNGKTDVWEILTSFNNYVVKHLKYGNPISGLYTLTDALTKRKVDCGGFDVLLGSLCQSVGIPARIVSGFWAGYKENGMHAWLEIMLPNGTWIPADPSIEKLHKQRRTKKKAHLGYVESDRIAVSVGTEISVPLSSRHITLDILQTPLIIASLGESSITTRSEFLTAST